MAQSNVNRNELHQYMMHTGQIFHLATVHGGIGEGNGKDHSQPCPLCGGNNRFWYSDAVGTFYCRKCMSNGSGYSIFDLVMNHRHITFPDAVQLLADASGYRLHFSNSPPKIHAPHAHHAPTLESQGESGAQMGHERGHKSPATDPDGTSTPIYDAENAGTGREGHEGRENGEDSDVDPILPEESLVPANLLPRCASCLNTKRPCRDYSPDRSGDRECLNYRGKNMFDPFPTQKELIAHSIDGLPSPEGVPTTPDYDEDF